MNVSAVLHATIAKNAEIAVMDVISSFVLIAAVVMIVSVVQIWEINHIIFGSRPEERNSYPLFLWSHTAKSAFIFWKK